jgi:hypothetical protein
MDRACTTDGGDEELHIGYWCESQMAIDHMENLDVVVCITLK